MAEATYYDGRTARAQAVALRIAGAVLEISAEDGHIIAEWPLKRLRRPAHAAAEAGALRVGLQGSDAQLVIKDEAFIAALLAAAPQIGPPRRTVGGLFFRTALFGFLSGAFFAAVFYGMPYVAGPAVKLIPYTAEARFGDNMARIYEAIPACEGAQAEAGLAVLKALVARLTDPEWPHPVSLRVIRNKDVNAFALPGGHVLVTEGLLAFIADGDELAGVLAHELGHVTKRHVMVSLVQQMGVLVLIDSLTGGSAGASGAIVEMATTYVGVRYTRRLEEEADREGIAGLLRANIDPTGVARLFERLEAREAERAKQAEKSGDGAGVPKKPSRIGDLMSTHPYGGDRARLAREAASGRTGFVPALTAEELTAVKAICPKAPRRPRHGGGEEGGGERPSRAREVEVIRL